MNRNIRFITRTAVLLAIALAFQFLGRFMGPQNNFIVGPVVNAVLLVATEFTGMLGGIFISLVAPVVSTFTNKAPIATFLIPFLPCIVAGNVILVLAYALLKKRNKIIAITVGAVAKAAFLYAAVLVYADIAKLKPATATILTNLFSWPQLLTAMLGGVIALAIMPALQKTLKD